MRCDLCGAPGVVALVTPNRYNVGAAVVAPILCPMHGAGLLDAARVWLQAQREWEGRPAALLAVCDDERGGQDA